MNRIIIAGVVLIGMFSCGPSQEEIKRIHFEKIEAGKALKAQQFEKYIQELEESLRYAKRELSDIKEFQIGRSMSTKKRQLSNQREVIAQIEDNIQVLNEEAIKTKIFEQFDFQDSPRGVVEELIYSAKIRDLSNLPHMIDPYGEFDMDIFELCYSHVSIDGKVNFIESFENARIINEVEYENGEAQIEFAYGPSSDRLETFNLIKRLDKWYLKSF